jgi:isoquinoline 1-oxidoreductase alpha subunit
MKVNDQSVDVPHAWREATLTSFLRDYLGFTGTKYGCGKGLCGACTVHIDGKALPSCVVPVSAVAGANVTTIEGLAKNDQLHPVQQAWIDLGVPQCGYCQPGQIMTAAAFLKENPAPAESEVARAMSGNLCRCGTYPRIRAGVARAAELARRIA